jgi:hypothetical protein
MGNVFPPESNETRIPETLIPEARHHDEDDGFDSDLNSEMITLLEENARLRALVTQLSSLVLKHVVDQK